MHAEGAGKAQQRVRRVVRPVSNRLWKFDLEGFDRLPAEGPAILCPNHVSFLDSAFLMLHVSRNISFVGKAEYMDSWKTKYLFPDDGHDPDRSRRRRQEPGGARHRRGGAAPRRAVRHLPRGHPQPRRRTAQGPHRRGPAGAEGRLPDLPGRHHRHPRDPTARRQGAEAAGELHDQDRSADQRRALSPPRRRPPGAAPDHRRVDVRDPRAHRPGLPQRVRRQDRGDRADPSRGRRPDDRAASRSWSEQPPVTSLGRSAGNGGRRPPMPS